MKQSKLVSASKAVAVWLPTVLLGLLFVQQGLMKVSGMHAWIERFEGWGYPGAFCYVIGVVELACGIALFVPRVAGLAAAGLAVVMLGAAGTHLVHGELPNTIFTAILVVVFVALARVRWPRFRAWSVAKST